MTSSRRFRLQAILCALALLVCELISRPFAAMNVCDDGPYIRMAGTFAQTGHIAYNGWEAGMMLAQIYLAQPLIKLFGYSYTTVRMTTLLVALVMAFVLHRILVRTGISERNATIGTLAVVLSPMYIMLSPTFMSDIYGLFAIVLCLYGCVRALEASGDRAAIAWICFAVFTCFAFGTSRQMAWMGDIAMVPSTLWLLRSRRRVLLAGAVATAIAFVGILACVHWFARQPYAVSLPVITWPFPTGIVLLQLSYIVLEIPFLVLPVIAAFIPRIFKAQPRTRALLLVALCAYVLIAFHQRRLPEPILRFEPTSGFPGSWINAYGIYAGLVGLPIVLTTKIVMILTAVCIGGLLGVIALAIEPRSVRPSHLAAVTPLSWNQLGVLLLPFCFGYLALMAAAAGTTHVIFDRYAIGLVPPAMIALLRLYQQRVQPALPLACVPLIIISAAYGIMITHNTFAIDRARVTLANEIHATGIPYTAIDGGWDYNIDTELNSSTHLNNPLVKIPADAFTIPRPDPPGYCTGYWTSLTPHIHADYAVSLSPYACSGLAPFAPVQYRRWPFRAPINLYAVRLAPAPPQDSKTNGENGTLVQ